MPVYERVGGHAYGSVYPGPIGSVLNPQLRGLDHPIDQSLPFASTLCGACADVCPVRIPIPDMLVHMRHKVADQKRGKVKLEPIAIAAAGWVLSDHKHFEFAQRLAGMAARMLPHTTHLGPLPWPASPWTKARDLPMPPPESFREWWKNREEGSK